MSSFWETRYVMAIMKVCKDVRLLGKIGEMAISRVRK